ncbi:Com family DNA-binding transcriptional regulator [Methyloceanibacter caenitepidi]|uniref:Com family DNA-binding transcriptional regulator n=1 Tax=Methyloceanibacter caenitepidi TaxID=1384459 RepID=A0A0A8K2F0_9HYPH|nr:hypothetical protein GL4_1475 [Methyloceanibacter caenitepidi]
MSLESIRCGKCAALLFKAAAKALSGRLEIKCRRCGHLNILRPEEPDTAPDDARIRFTASSAPRGR